MAFYISQPKVRQAGFDLPTKEEDRAPSPGVPYDPSMYFAHNNFGSPFDAFSNARLKFNGDHPNVDFADTLASMISESDARNAANGVPPTNGHHGFHSHPFEAQGFSHAAPNNHAILSPTGSAFSPNGHHHHHLQHAHPHLPASAPAGSHPSFFDSGAHDYAFFRAGTLTDRADTPSLASPTTADSPFSQTGPQISTAPSKRRSGSGAASRSRSRGPAAASTSRSRARKRPSVSSPSPPPGAVLIPGQNAWYIPSHGESGNSSFGFALGSHGTASSLGMPMPAGQSPKSMGAKPSAAEDIAQKQAQLLSEKRRRRRESHNAVERRRRDNINEKISELSTLIPECLLVEAPAATTGKDDMLGAVDEEAGKEGPKVNKGIILRKSVDYIKYLQQLVRVQASRNRELESQLSQYRGPDESPNLVGPLGLSGLGMDGQPVDVADLDKLLAIPDADGEEGISGELSDQILATLETSQEHSVVRPIIGNSPSADGMDEDDDGEETERGRQAARRGRFGYPSLSVGHSAKVEEVDETALSADGEKMED